MLLSRKRCPHTGVVNLFIEAEPHLAIGSVLKADGSAGYHVALLHGPLCRDGNSA